LKYRESSEYYILSRKSLKILKSECNRLGLKTTTAFKCNYIALLWNETKSIKKITQYFKETKPTKKAILETKPTKKAILETKPTKKAILETKPSCVSYPSCPTCSKLKTPNKNISLEKRLNVVLKELKSIKERLNPLIYVLENSISTL
jgi:tRNA(Ile)-lysidine synthase TilS/MesJ